MDTLEKIAPIPVRLDIKEERLDLTPIKTKELPAMMRSLAPVLTEIQSCDVMTALAKNADAVIEAVSIGCRKSREWADELDLDELVQVAAAVIEVNADFFVRAVLPKLNLAVEGLTSTIGRKP